MAEGLLRHDAIDRFEVDSAGMIPSQVRRMVQWVRPSGKSAYFYRIAVLRHGLGRAGAVLRHSPRAEG